MPVKQHKQRLFEGLPVVDSKSPVTIHVEDQDIKGARKNDPGGCAAAKAGQRELKKDVRVFLTRTYIKSADKKHWVRYITPESAGREIVAFDRGAAFCEGSYKLMPPCKGAQLGSHRGRSFEGPREWGGRR